MNDKNRRNSQMKKHMARSAKECAFVAVFVALVIAAQLALSAVPGVETVTVLFCAYSFTFGVRRGVAAATAFSLLRQLLFGFFPCVLVLYLVYYNLLATAFALLARRIENPRKGLPVLVLAACVCTVCFTLFDNILTPLWYAYSARAAQAYFVASLPFMGTQTLCAGVCVSVLFLPLQKAFKAAKRGLTGA